MTTNNTKEKAGFGIKFLITVSALASTLGLWSIFAKEAQIVSENLSASMSNGNTNPTPEPKQAIIQPTPFTRIYLGGASPSQQTYSSQQQPITQTQSSQ